MATLTGHLVADTYKALLKLIDNDIVTAAEKQISDGLGGGTNVFIDQNGFLRAKKYKVTDGISSQFLKADGSLDSTAYLPVGTTTTNIPEGTNLYFTTNRVLNTLLTGFVSTEGTVTAADSILTAINKIWWNIENGGGGGGGYVPYTGATQNLNLGTYGLISDYVQFNTTNSSIPTTAGTMAWNSADGTVDLKMGGANVTLQVGQEELVRVVNKTGANLLEANYQAVRISGAQGNRLKVALAKADNDANSADTIGLVTETINDNQEGFVTSVGLVRNINTTGTLQSETWADGDMLYLSATTAGKITNIKPIAPQHGVRIGYVVRAHQTQGQIYVKVDNGYELDELHNVKITDPQNDDFLMYNSTQSLWANKDLHGVEGYLPYYGVANVFEQSPIFTDGTQVIVGSDTEFATGNKLSVVGNLAVDGNYGYHLGTYQILFRYNATGEFRIGTNAANDFTTFFANGIERMRLNASGYLGIGLTSPSQPLHVKGVLAYPKIIIDNNSTSGGGAFSAYQNGTETANFGISGAWLADSSSDVAIVATRAGKGIQFYTNGSTSEKMGINSDGNVFIGQLPTYVAGTTQLIVRGKTGAGYVGVNHYDMSIKGSMNTFNSVFQIGTSTFHSVSVIVEDIERARFNSGGRMLLGTTTDNTVDIFQANGSIIATAIKKTGGTSSQYLMADGSVSSGNAGTVTSVGASVPTGFSISGSPITTSGTLAITFASGYSLPTTIKQSNWDDAYTWVSGFPSQTGNSGKFLTTDGSTLSWSNVVLGVTSFNTRTGAITLLSADVTGALGYTPVPTTRTLSINGTSYDLSADRSWTISAGANSRNVSTFTATAGQTTFTITGGYTPNLVDVYVNGARLNANDYVATSGTSVVLNIGVVVNDIVEVVNYVASSVASITGTGTSGYIPKWTGSSVLANSLIYDNGTSVGIGTITPDIYSNIGTGLGVTMLASGTNTSANLNIIGNGTGFGGISLGNSSIRRAGIFALDGSILAFYTNSTNSGTSLTERIRILSSGFVGIGTTTIGAPLTVLSDNSNAYTFNLLGRSADNASTINFFNNAGSTRYGFLYNDPNGMYVGVNGSTRLQITTSGRLIQYSDGYVVGSGASNTVAGGSFLAVANAAQSNWVLQQLNGSFGLDWWTYSVASGWLQRMTLTQDGNLGLGSITPDFISSGDRVFTIQGVGTRATINLQNSSTGTGGVAGSFRSYNGSTFLTTIDMVADGATNKGAFIFYTNNAGSIGERIRLSSAGFLGIGTSNPTEMLNVYTSQIKWLVNLQHGNGTQFFINFMNPSGGQVGSIMGNGSSTSYNTTSDYRLKEDLKPIKGLEKVSKMNVYDFKWKNFENRMDGVIAHELQEILPYAVTGIKDGEKNQEVDYTKIVPVLIQSIKELNAEIISLKSK